MDKHTVKGYLFAVLSAIIYGSMPLMATHIYADGVTPVTLVFLRNLLSLPLLAFLAFREQKTLKIPGKLLPSIALLSLLGCCVTPVLLFSSYRFIASGTATVIHFIYPAIVVLSEMLFFKARKQTGNMIGVLLCIAGIGCFYSPQEGFNLAGGALALVSGITFAAYVVLLSHFRKHGITGFLFCFYVTACSSAGAFLLCLVGDALVLPASGTGWGLCLLFSLLVTTGAVSLFQKSTFLIGSERTSILSTFEPITSLLLGVLLMGEPLSIRMIVGSLLVITASILIAAFDMRKKA